MLPCIRSIFRKLCRGGSKPALSLPSTAVETHDLPPRAIHTSDVERSSPIKLRPAESQSIYIMVVNVKSTINYQRLYWLLGHEKEQGYESDPYGEYDTRYFCDGYAYEVEFAPPVSSSYIAMLSIQQHVCLVFTYDASSRESWNELVAIYERMRSRFEDGILPFVGTLIAAMGEGAVSHEEAEVFASQRGCSFVKVSPVTGKGVCGAVGSLVERAHAHRDQHLTQMDSSRSEHPGADAYRDMRHKRAKEIGALFAE